MKSNFNPNADVMTMNNGNLILAANRAKRALVEVQRLRDEGIEMKKAATNRNDYGVAVRKVDSAEKEIRQLNARLAVVEEYKAGRVTV